MDLLAGPVDARLGDADREREPAALDAADVREGDSAAHRGRKDAFSVHRGGYHGVGVRDELVMLHRLGELGYGVGLRLGLELGYHQLLGAEAGNAGLGVVAGGRLLRDVARLVRIGREQDAAAARAGD